MKLKFIFLFTIAVIAYSCSKDDDTTSKVESKSFIAKFSMHSLRNGVIKYDITNAKPLDTIFCINESFYVSENTKYEWRVQDGLGGIGKILTTSTTKDFEYKFNVYGTYYIFLAISEGEKKHEIYKKLVVSY